MKEMKYTFKIFMLASFMVMGCMVYGQEITAYDTITRGDDHPTPLVSAMNMNVLYRGLDNPVEIVVPGNYDQAIIECNGAKMTGENGVYLIKPVTTNDVIVSVSTIVKGKIRDTTKFQFRVKPVPTPEIVWCGKSSGEKVKASNVGSFSSTCDGGGGSPLIPRMANFDFAVYATIQSFDIAYSMNGKLIERRENKGNQIPKDISDDIKTLPGGTTIFFSNVRIVCPGGDTRISSATFTIE